ncbi:hypothetical protein [Streptomyces sp. W1SF4]|uniref:hypothetical protein n=1 Tax=Streptomyces sp. W1SF4 TaxID=2305220 RepID=UPI0013E08645|nr:hypothetical protein [Streptomyces sp. W1SF4]
MSPVPAALPRSAGSIVGGGSARLVNHTPRLPRVDGDRLRSALDHARGPMP